jgi:hypothetical protein
MHRGQQLLEALGMPVPAAWARHETHAEDHARAMAGRDLAEFVEDFIRGLIHSYGCRSMNRVKRSFRSGDRWYEYPRYFFTNESTDIRRLFTDALDRLGITWKQSNRKTISVARREAVARLDEFVGPKY